MYSFRQILNVKSDQITFYTPVFYKIQNLPLISNFLY